MCGIAGEVRHRATARRAVVADQLRFLDHRGPDSWGVFAAGRGAVGQTRLAIIDLVTGDPPIATPDGAIGVAFNGEIYNYRALRDGLLAGGHTLHTKGDTEVIAHLAEDLEPVQLARALDGMFAAAVWDTRCERLVLVRDRLGKKPLYWWQGPEGIVFGSELKAVVAHPDVPSRLDPDAIPAYLGFGYVPTPRTFYDGITSVPPGHVLIVERDGTVRAERYWGVSASTPKLSIGLAEAARAVRAGLDTAVERRLISDVPLGAFLSGGVDSSAIVALMAQHTTMPVRTFTIGFEDADGFDERPHARSVAERYGTDHVEFVVEPRAVDLVEELVWHHDQPFGDSSAVPTYLLSELTRKHVTVALCGDGGDELFAGYERFAAGRVAGTWAAMPAPARRTMRALAGLAGSRASKLQRFARVADLGLPDAFRQWISYIEDDLLDRLSPGTTRWAQDDYRAIWNASAPAPALDRLLDLNLRTYLLDDLLPKVDRMSMAHGLEVRAPFLDHELVELAFRLPPATKQRGMSLKRVLKAAVADLLPAEILERPKHGFGVPLARWFRDDLAALVDGTIGDPAASIRQHLRGEAIDLIVAEHRRSAADHGHVLWTLLTLEIFLRRQGW